MPGVSLLRFVSLLPWVIWYVYELDYSCPRVIWSDVSILFFTRSNRLDPWIKDARGIGYWRDQKDSTPEGSTTPEASQMNDAGEWESTSWKNQCHEWIIQKDIWMWKQSIVRICNNLQKEYSQKNLDVKSRRINMQIVFWMNQRDYIVRKNSRCEIWMLQNILPRERIHTEGKRCAIWMRKNAK